ncbi:MAG: glutamate racemase [Candidatus Competibacteraceae bacterium]|nr:glutamate racemase [Candidatus Competibacteraceae bacterium]
MKQPIGVFDSGIGGLSVLREIRALLSKDDLLYVADSGFAPYGHRSVAFIVQRSLLIARFLMAHNAKAIVVACNTATAAAVATLRDELPIPIIGMEPGIKPAAVVSRSKIIGVLATESTLNSDRFSALLTRTTEGMEIIVQPCPGLVEQIEAGNFTGPATHALVTRFITPLLTKGVDTLVLGCTHYPLVRQLIAQIAGPTVQIIDTGPAVARHLRDRLTDATLHCDSDAPGKETFWTSGSPTVVQSVIAKVWGRAVEVERI